MAFSAGPHSFASAQLDLPPDLQASLRAWTTANVAREDLSPLEQQDDAFHVTVLYGIRTDEPRDIEAALRGCGAAFLLLGSVQAFTTNPAYDVLVVSLLREVGVSALRQRLTSMLPWTATQAAYVPHVTLAYVVKGVGKRLVGSPAFVGRSAVVDRLRYTTSHGVATWVSLLPTRELVVESGRERLSLDGEDVHIPIGLTARKKRRSAFPLPPVLGVGAISYADLHWTQDEAAGVVRSILADHPDWGKAQVATELRRRLGVLRADGRRRAHPATADDPGGLAVPEARSGLGTNGAGKQTVFAAADGLSRQPTKYERKVDFAAIKRELDALEAQGRERVRGLLVAARDKLLALVSRKHADGSLTTRFVADLELRGLGQLVPTLREILRAAFGHGSQQAGQELYRGRLGLTAPKAHAREYFNPDHMPAGTPEGGQFAPAGSADTPTVLFHVTTRDALNHILKEGFRTDAARNFKESSGGITYFSQHAGNVVPSPSEGLSIEHTVGKVVSTLKDNGTYVLLRLEIPHADAVGLGLVKDPDSPGLVTAKNIPARYITGRQEFTMGRGTAVKLRAEIEKLPKTERSIARLVDVVDNVPVVPLQREMLDIRVHIKEGVMVGYRVAIPDELWQDDPRSYQDSSGGGFGSKGVKLDDPASVLAMVRRIVAAYPTWTRDQIRIAVQRKLRRARAPMLRGGGGMGGYADGGTGRIYQVTLTPEGLLPQKALEFFDGRASLAGSDLRDPLLSDVKNALMNAVKTGQPMLDTMAALTEVFLPWLGDPDQLVDELTLTPYRLETLIRTSTTEAMNEGRKAQFQPEVDSGFVIGLQYTAILDTRTTEVCRFLDGLILPPDGPEVNELSPPRHYNCFINPGVEFFTNAGWKTWTDLKIGDEVLTHKGRFRKVTEKMFQPAEYVEVVRVRLAADQPRGGKPFRTFCVTPEHPVLVDGWWKTAGKLLEGESLTLLAHPCRKCGKPAPWFRQTCAQRCAGALHEVTETMKRRLSADMRRQYIDGRRDRFQTTKGANRATRRLVKQGKWVLQNPEVRKLGMIAQTKRNYGTTWLESRLGWALTQAGLAPVKQLALPRNGVTKQGHPRYVFPDFAFPEQKVAVEADGWRHTTEEGIAADRARDMELVALGWTVLRFPQAAINRDLHACAAQVSRVLANHDGDYSSLPVKVAKVERYFVHAPRYNFAVEEDESYVGPAGIIMHNCRSLLSPVLRTEGPVEYITAAEVARGRELSGVGFADQRLVKAGGPSLAMAGA